MRSTTAPGVPETVTVTGAPTATGAVGAETASSVTTVRPAAAARICAIRAFRTASTRHVGPVGSAARELPDGDLDGGGLEARVGRVGDHPVG